MNIAQHHTSDLIDTHMHPHQNGAAYAKELLSHEFIYIFLCSVSIFPCACAVFRIYRVCYEFIDVPATNFIEFICFRSLEYVRLACFSRLTSTMSSVVIATFRSIFTNA